MATEVRSGTAMQMASRMFSDALGNAFMAPYKGAMEQAQIDRDFAREQANTAYERNSLEAQKQRDFEERMSNTAYKRAAAQLRELGINPYVLLSGFSAASTPSGSSASAPVGNSVSGSSAYASVYGSNAAAAASRYAADRRYRASIIGSVVSNLTAFGASALRSL